MTRNNQSIIRYVLAIGLLFLSTQTVKAEENWWSMPDVDFVKKYKSLAVGSISDQSKFAWMLFARVNQPAKLNGVTLSEWEVWPSNLDTFSPIAPQIFMLKSKTRPRPHLQESVSQMLHEKAGTLELNGGIPTANEEVTRNMISYKYITDKNRPLNTRGFLVKALEDSQPIDMPIGSIEVKAIWAFTPIEGAYQISDGQTTYSLVALHIMAKIAETPNDPFNSPSPSWFWTTFEFYKNAGLSDALKFVTYQNTMSKSDIIALLNEAKLNNTNFSNYVSDGVQIQYVDQQSKNPVILGNTKLEDFAFEPTTPPWKSWNSSCHTCHGTSSGYKENNNWKILPFGGDQIQVGNIKNMNANSKSIDFNWSIPRQAR
ncbi:MAG: hypothetical protein ACXV8I_04025 [Methylobacter sp.]